jgi:hypothetical protein
MSAFAGTTWLAWRNNRVQAAIGGLLAAGTAAVLVAVAITVNAHPTAPQHTTYLEAVLVGAPAVAGVFFAAPLLAADFERGTHLLIWTQGITRRRWAAANLGLLMGLTALAAAVLAVGGQIWLAQLPHGVESTWNLYDLQAPLVVADSLFAVALGAATGAAVRRTVPAMGATLAIFIAVRIAFAQLVRPNLLPSVTRMVGGSAGTFVTPSGANQIDIAVATGPLGPNTPFRIVYQPASHFWPMQAMEAGIFIALALLLVWVALRFATRDG